MRVQEIMTRDPVSVSPDATVREAAQIMKRDNVGIVPVVERADKRLLGVVTDRDIAIRCVAEGRDSATCRVQDVMSGERLSTCRPNDDVDAVMNAMGKEQVRRIPIVDERGSLVGIVSQADIVRKANDKRAEKTIEEISRPTSKHSQ